MLHIKGTEKTIQICDCDLKEFYELPEEFRAKINRAIKEMNDKIANGEKVMYRTVLDELGIPVEGYDDELLDFWGFDKKGFRQLYKKKVTVEIVPID